MIARIGGDEFVVLQLAEKPATAAAALAKKVQAILGTSFDLDDHQIVVSTTIGIAIGPGDGSDADQLLKNADLALNRAKQRRPRHLALLRARDGSAHAGAPQARARPACGAAQRRVRALLPAAAQPASAARSPASRRCCAGTIPSAGSSCPSEFIPLAEETGLIVPIGEWTLRQACTEAANWPKGLKVAVNLSAAQFRFGNVRQAVITALGASAARCRSRLELEVTESVLLQESEDVADDARASCTTSASASRSTISAPAIRR